MSKPITPPISIDFWYSEKFGSFFAIETEKDQEPQRPPESEGEDAFRAYMISNNVVAEALINSDSTLQNIKGWAIKQFFKPYPNPDFIGFLFKIPFHKVKINTVSDATYDVYEVSATFDKIQSASQKAFNQYIPIHSRLIEGFRSAIDENEEAYQEIPTLAGKLDKYPKLKPRESVPSTATISPIATETKAQKLLPPSSIDFLYEGDTSTCCFAIKTLKGQVHDTTLVLQDPQNPLDIADQEKHVNIYKSFGISPNFHGILVLPISTHSEGYNVSVSSTLEQIQNTALKEFGTKIPLDDHFTKGLEVALGLDTDRFRGNIGLLERLTQGTQSKKPSRKNYDAIPTSIPRSDKNYYFKTLEIETKKFETLRGLVEKGVVSTRREFSNQCYDALKALDLDKTQMLVYKLICQLPDDDYIVRIGNDRTDGYQIFYINPLKVLETIKHNGQIKSILDHAADTLK